LLVEQTDTTAGIDEWTARAGGYIDKIDLVGVLRGVCVDATDMVEFCELTPAEQAAVWRAIGILDVARFMSGFWEQGLVDCAYNALLEAHNNCSDRDDELAALDWVDECDELDEILRRIDSRR